jgi:hypothetical protein
VTWREGTLRCYSTNGSVVSAMDVSLECVPRLALGVSAPRVQSVREEKVEERGDRTRKHGLEGGTLPHVHNGTESCEP